VLVEGGGDKKEGRQKEKLKPYERQMELAERGKKRNRNRP